MTIFSGPLYLSVAFGHYIDEKLKHLPIINFEAIWRILVPSTWFLLEYLSVFLFSIFFVYLLGRLLKKRNILALRFALHLFAQTDTVFQRCSAIGLFFVANLLFLFLVQQILANNVKTGKLFNEQCSSNFYLLNKERERV